MANKTKTAVNVKPLADRVVVLPLDEDEQMRGSLYIPDTGGWVNRCVNVSGGGLPLLG